MEINKINSLVELYFKSVKGLIPTDLFKMVKTRKTNYSWGDIKERVFKLTSKIQSLIKDGDRCLILSENRPYWLMTDIAIMNAGGYGAYFTTYSPMIMNIF